MLCIFHDIQYFSLEMSWRMQTLEGGTSREVSSFQYEKQIKQLLSDLMPKMDIGYKMMSDMDDWLSLSSIQKL